MDSKERNLIRVAKQSVNSDINERIATETESHHVDEEEDYLSVGAAADKEDLVQDDENGADSDHDDQFSDNEDYGNEGRVYRVMCREVKLARFYHTRPPSVATSRDWRNSGEPDIHAA
ncbi:Hypothetical predicted protein [Mytilus galloprovincialis]|uniref:Uncharacterized protein n=1 Tax=Mytilus galloprovincialis TaxID=29158 RepID=A0A8B6GI42_MYTGA|nr:Hypothetical predicted protein [Mytilus galloprovincialis]